MYTFILVGLYISFSLIVLKLSRSIKARFHYERGKKHSLFVLLLFFCARFNFNRSLQSKINKRKNALFHASSGNGP